MIELLHIDCMEYMAGLPDKAFDLAIVDPPYGIGAGKMTMGSLSRNSTGQHNLKAWDSAPPDAAYFAELRRVSCNQIIWGGNYFQLPPSRCWLLWDKQDPNSDFASHEMAWTSFDAVVKVFSMSRKAASLMGGIHPTQKPVGLYRWILKNYAKPGQRILDTHGGSMSIAIACDIEGFDLVGCEIDADYIKAARKRLADHQAQPRLFDAQKPTNEQQTMKL